MKITMLRLLVCICIFTAPYIAAQQTNPVRLTTLAADKQLSVQSREPFRIFDNLYYVGVTYVGAFLLTTD